MNDLSFMITLFCAMTGLIITFGATFQIIKKHKTSFKTIVFGILLSTLSIPFLINESYKLGSITAKGYYTLWEAKDELSFYGSLLAFLGMVSLGGLALLQNKKFKKENDIAQSRIEEINNKLLDLDTRREKEKLFEIYFSYLDETQKLFDPIYIIGMPKENRSLLDIYSTIKSCHLNILGKKRRLLFLDKDNSGNNFSQYVEEKTNEITRIALMKEDNKQEVDSQLFKFWRVNTEKFNRSSLIFMMEIYKSIFGK